MIINERNIKMWSTIGQRATFGVAALELAKELENLMVLTCDVSTSAGLDRYRKTYPNKYLDIGIAEQNMIGIAAGLASENYDVVTTTFAPFQTMRCCEQIKVNVGYMKKKISMVGIASGLVLGNLGYTHCCIEDIGVLRSIPGMTILSPADCLEAVKAIEYSIKSKQSTYIRLTGSSNAPIIYNQDYDFKVGKSVILNEGEDVTIFCTGAIVSNCLKAAKILESKSISCKVINMHTIKPIDTQAIEESLGSKIIVSVEEHNIIGGLGESISGLLVKNNLVPMEFVGVEDSFGESGTPSELMKKYGLSSQNIYKKCKKAISRKQLGV